jgi:pimeloyl-ACP methyl ester carboxylesterase
VKRKRPKGWLAIGWACVESAAFGRAEHVPTSEDYPDSVVRRTSFKAGGGHGWRISALETPRRKPTAWKIVVITGAPSWSEYWAPVMAALPADREMIVVDRPGFANSEPHDHVPDIRVQAQALAPLLRPAPGQKIVLVGQSYGAAIATLMAAAQPRAVGSLVLLSGYFGEAGPTARMLLDLGARALNLIPRDLRNAVLEVRNQAPQLDVVRAALSKLKIPVHVVHGDKDDFAPIEIAERLVAETRGKLPVRVERVAGGDHFINDGPVEALMSALESCIPARRPWLSWPTPPRLAWPRVRIGTGDKWPAGSQGQATAPS